MGFVAVSTNPIFLFVHNFYRYLMNARSIWSSVAVIVFCTGFTLAHDGPDPIAHWKFDSYSIDGNKVKARIGPDAEFNGSVRLLKDEHGQACYLNGRGVEAVIADDGLQLDAGLLPKSTMTVAAWVSIDQREDDGGIIGIFQDNGDAETGWVLGYRKNRFCFGLATEGSDDGNGKITYLTADEPFELGKFYFVVAVYDGRLMELYVNGRNVGRSEQQQGDVLYPEAAPFVMGAYHDRNEFNPMRGCLREIMIFDRAAKAAWVKQEFDHQRKVAQLAKRVFDGAREFVVKPYLQYGTQTSMAVAWQSATPCQGVVQLG